MSERELTVEDYITEIARKHKVPPELALAVVKRESGGVHQRGGQVTTGAPTPSGQARGMFQLLPSTAYGEFKLDPNNLGQNIEAGVRYLRKGLDVSGNDPVGAAAFYHGGPDLKQHGPKTREYADAIGAELLGIMQARAGQPPEKPPAAAAAAALNPLRPETWIPGFLQEATQSINPVTIWESIKAVPSMVAHPIDTATAMWDTQKRLREEGAAMEAGAPTLDQALRGQGSWEDYRRGLAARFRTSAGWVPLLGPRLAEAEEFAREGEYGRGAGALVDVAGQVLGPKAIRGRGGRVRTVPRLFKPQLSRAEQAAIDLGRAEGVPLDVATVSQNPFAAKLQRSVEATAGGAPTARRVFREREELLPQIGQRQAGQVAHPAPVSREAAGEGLRTGTERYIRGQHARADFAYDQLRQIEADPAYTRQVQVGTTNQWTPQGTLQTVPVMGPMQLPADVSAIKGQLRTVYDRMANTVTDVARRQASPGLTALKNLVDGPDFVPALQLERDLGAIKALGRGPDLPELRNVSQGLASLVTKSVEPVVDQALSIAPGSRTLLTEGRQATRLKWMTEKLLKKTSEEPTQAFRKATAPLDQNARYLEELARRAPSEMPRLGRALLEDIFTHGRTGVDTWEAARTMNKRWQSIGPQTRAVLFPQGTAELDSLFQLHEMLARTPNPSGTALTSTAVGTLRDAFTQPLTGVPTLLASRLIAKAMNHPWWIELMTEGRTIPAGTPRAAAWTTAAIEQLAESVLDEQNEQARGGPRVGTPPPTMPR